MVWAVRQFILYESFTDFSGVMALLIALSYKNGNRLCMSGFFRSKEMFKLHQNSHVSLSASKIRSHRIDFNFENQFFVFRLLSDYTIL